MNAKVNTRPVTLHKHTIKKPIPAKASPLKKYLVDSYLAVFSTNEQQKIIRGIERSGVSLFIINRIRRTLITDAYNARHEDLKIIYNALKQFNTVYKKQFGSTLKSIDDLIQKSVRNAGK